jgi:tetratricopeptide (TPR) repeat protein
VRQGALRIAGLFAPEALAESRRCWRYPASMRAMCGDYRAGATIDHQLDEAAAQLERLESEGNYLYQARVIQSFLRRDWAAMIRVDTAWIAFSAHPAAFASRGMALLLTGDFDLAVADLEQALRLSPRDPLRAEWQYRLAAAHFFAERDELAHEWAQTAAELNPRTAAPHPTSLAVGSPRRRSARRP